MREIRERDYDRETGRGERERKRERKRERVNSDIREHGDPRERSQHMDSYMWGGRERERDQRER